MKSPFDVVLYQYQKEKSSMLLDLQNAESNQSLARCKTPKYVFIVDPSANKTEIAKSIEAMYPGVEVTAVNTSITKPKRKKARGRVRKQGTRAGYKKAVVSLKAGQSLEMTS